MAKRKSVGRKDKLAALRDKLANTDLGGTSGFWSPNQGSNVIRILPEVGEMDWFFQEVGRHYFPNKKQVYCPNFTSEGELDCPVCELVNDLYRAGDPASKKLAGDLRVRKMYWMNVVVMDGDKANGPYIYTPGVTVFSFIAALINDPDYGDIFDIDEGTDITIEREGTGLNTEYHVIPRRYPSVLEDADSFLKEAKDLSWVEVSEDPEEDGELSAGHAVYLLPYDRIVAEFDLDLGLDELAEILDDESAEDYEDEEEEEVEEEHPVKQEVKRRRRRRR